MTTRSVGFALIVVGVCWLSVISFFVYAGLVSGKVQDMPAAILGIGVFGAMPAMLMWVVAAVLLQRAGGEAREQVTADLQEEILERVQTRGRCSFEELSRELDARPSDIESGIYDLVGKRLFTGYVNWRGREIISAEAEKISGNKCPNCGGAIELAGKSMARCPYCGTETYLAQGKP
ncbi:MAG: hypothetical protein ABFE08_04475 [Armatimonadia bacterium]